ncbi:hypothetical protein YC2023_019634 [Brassica napus]
MDEPDDSSTKDKPGWINGEHTDLKPADETEDELEPAEKSMHELKPAEVRVDELDELSEPSDTSLELNELSETEDEAGLIAGRNEPFTPNLTRPFLNLEHFLFLGAVSSNIKRLSAPLVSLFNPSVLPFGEFISL